MGLGAAAHGRRWYAVNELVTMKNTSFMPPNIIDKHYWLDGQDLSQKHAISLTCRSNSRPSG